MAIKKLTLNGNGYDTNFDKFAVFIFFLNESTYTTVRYRVNSSSFQRYHSSSSTWGACSYDSYIILKAGDTFDVDIPSGKRVFTLILPIKNNYFKVPDTSAPTNMVYARYMSSSYDWRYSLADGEMTINCGSIPNDSIDGNLILKSGMNYFTIDKDPIIPVVTGYSVTYHSNGGTPIPSDLTEQTTLPNPLPTVSKSGYRFDGWYTNSTFTTPAVAGAMIEADIDLYAKFTRTNITLDLSTIGLSVGTHSIQMKLSDDGVTRADSALSNAVTYAKYQQLTAPVISLSGDILTWSAVPNASSYKLYSDNTDQGTVTSGVNLTTLQLATGSHSIQVMAVGSGYYTDSDKSNSVSYTVLPQLSTPANLTADGTTISFDEVENAEKYEVFADGTSIGEYAVPSGFSIISDPISIGIMGIKLEYNNGTTETLEDYDAAVGFERNNVVKITDMYVSTCGISRLSLSLSGTSENLKEYLCELNNNSGWNGFNQIPNFGYILTEDLHIVYADNTCLASNTLVLTDDGYQEIKDIGVDTMLLTYNADTKSNEYKRVTKWWHHPSSDLATINDNLFTMTGDHPIYVNDYEVVKGREVKVGDYLIDKDGNKVLVEKVEFSNEPIEVYMIEVEDNHNFYITDKNLLSHNY